MQLRKNILAVMMVGTATLLGGASSCDPDEGAEPDPDADTPLAHGHAQRVDDPSCNQGSLAEDAIALVTDWLGGSVTVDRGCGTYTREIATGVVLGEPDVAPGEKPYWKGLGGRGELMADAAVCMLADLGNHPDQAVTSTSPPVWTAFGPVYVEQTIGYVDWEPDARRFDGYQNVSVCAPLLGCLDATRQAFRATVRESDPVEPWGLMSGDYPIVASYSVELWSEESSYSVDATLPPIVVVTPYGPVSVEPQLHYGTQLEVIDSPFDGQAHDAHAMFFDWYWTQLDDTYGRAGTPLVTSLVGLEGGWASQLGLGGRDGRPTATIWAPDPADAVPHRYDLDLALPRSAHEREPVVSFGAGADIRYSPTDLLPSSFLSSPFDVSFYISVKPQLDAYYASQLEILSREGKRNSLDLGDHDTTRSEVFLARGVTASAEANIDVTVHLSVTVWTPWGDEDVIDIHEVVTIPLGGGEASSELPGPAFARSGSRPNGPAGLSYAQTWASGAVDEASFIDDCYAQDPEPAPVPPAQHHPGSPDLDPGLYPCNICVVQNSVATDDVDVPADLTTLFPYGEPTWSCRQHSNGCFDLCRFDSTTGQFTAIEKSAPELLGWQCMYDPPR